MDGYTKYDIRKATFDEFVDFLFDRELIPVLQEQPAAAEPWYWHAEVTFDPMRVASFYILLFTAPRMLLERFSASQLEQAFWAIQSSNIECAVTEVIWHPQIPFEIRESCVRSMLHLYELLFSDATLETSPNMWWDSLAYDWHCGNRSRANGGEDEAMQDVMFETLGKILQLPSVSCQEAAIHGLGHLHHPGTSNLISAYLAQNPRIDENLREYALAAARFEVM